MWMNRVWKRIRCTFETLCMLYAMLVCRMFTAVLHNNFQFCTERRKLTHNIKSVHMSCFFVVVCLLLPAISLHWRNVFGIRIRMCYIQSVCICGLSIYVYMVCTSCISICMSRIVWLYAVYLCMDVDVFVLRCHMKRCTRATLNDHDDEEL